ncbi:MAG: FumA C-terminus/TtdB family hydratase beta subunit [Methanomethylovorans sp.]|uniref:FumA C-terminus/TtdB family hydratase beta subunit n=1 Tax=Methanomethylovorans sp. TaxID=2758717 RepID=UPI003530BA04
MSTYELVTPLKAEDITQLSVGDVVYISGIVYTARDEAHAHILELDEAGEKLPIDLEGAVIYHCGPLMVQENDQWKAVASGPTTSARMAKMTPKLLEKHNVRALIGKGGMQGVTETLKDRCVYLAYTGGCAALAAGSIKKVRSVHWLQLGMPEAVWELEVERFGPLIVGIDAHGNDLFEKVREKALTAFCQLR